MSREAHVQFCERLGVRFPGATLPPGTADRASPFREYYRLYGQNSANGPDVANPSPIYLRQILSPQLALSENPKQIARQQAQQHGTKSYACSSACTPSAVAIVSSAPTEYEHQDNYEYDEHLRSSPIRNATAGFCHRLNQVLCLNSDELIAEPEAY